MFYFILLCITLMPFHLLLGQEKPIPPPLPSLDESETAFFRKLVEGNNRFGFDLYQHLKLQQGNLFFSPFCIASGVGMLAMGAKGETARQFQQTFSYSPFILLLMGDLNNFLQKSSPSKNAAQFFMANGLWLDKSIPILPSYKNSLMNNYQTSVHTVDFAKNINQALKEINEWTLQKTQRKIGSIASSQDINAQMHMVLTTTAGLNGDWMFPFNPKLSKRLSFQVSAQRSVSAQMMTNTATYSIAKEDPFEIVIVPLKQEEGNIQLAMAVCLPKKEIAFKDIEKQFTWENWLKWKGKLQSRKVTIILPQLRIDRRFDLAAVLKGLGLQSFFAKTADFSQMTSQSGIFLDQAIHKSLFNLSEAGIDRSTPFKSASNQQDEQSISEFTVDRPFIFLILDQKTDSILFMGRVLSP